MNSQIKSYAKANNVKLWQIAEALGMQDSNFSKKLRHKLTEAETNTIREVIEKLAMENLQNGDDTYGY